MEVSKKVIIHKQVVITFDGEPKTKSNNYVFKNGRLFPTSKTQEYEKKLAKKAFAVMNKYGLSPFENAVSLTIIYTLGSRRKKDIQNLVKTTCDALNGIVYEDDSQICELIVYKAYDKKNPHITVIAKDLEEDVWEYAEKKAGE